MNIAELIERLKGYDMNAEVFIPLNTEETEFATIRDMFGGDGRIALIIPAVSSPVFDYDIIMSRKE